MKSGAQLYTVRDYIQTPEGVEQTFRKVAEIGYPAVQVSGIGPIEPERLRDIAKEYGLQIVLTHTSPDRIRNETDAVIREHRIFGCSHVGIGSMPASYERSADGYRQFLADFMPAARRLHDEGMKLHYHNHNFEFERYGDKTGMDILIEESDPDLLDFTVDTYWVQAGGCNPVKLLRDLAGRISMVHYKDMKIAGGGQRMAAVGKGNLDFREITDACLAGGCEFALVEQDDTYGADPFEELAASYRYIETLLK